MPKLLRTEPVGLVENSTAPDFDSTAVGIWLCTLETLLPREIEPISIDDSVPSEPGICAVETIDVVTTEPATLVVVMIATTVESITEALEVDGTEIAGVDNPVTVEPATSMAGLASFEDDVAGIKAVNVLEKVTADPAEFVKVTPKTVVAEEKDMQHGSEG